MRGVRGRVRAAFWAACALVVAGLAVQLLACGGAPSAIRPAKVKVAEGNGERVRVEGAVLECGPTTELFRDFFQPKPDDPPAGRHLWQIILQAENGGGGPRCLFVEHVADPICSREDLVIVEGVRLLDEQPDGAEARKGDLVECKLLRRRSPRR